jgi:hypothetical protein
VAESPLAKMPQIRAGAHVLALDAPDSYLEDLAPLPDGVQLFERAHGHFDVVQAFVRMKADVDRRAPIVVNSAKPGAVIWLCWPKQSAHVATDLNRDVLVEQARAYGLRAVSNISIDETWSALRFKTKS